MSKILKMIVILVAIPISILSQTYYKTIEYVGNNTFKPAIPKGYNFYLTGPVSSADQQVIFTFNGETFTWTRTNDLQTTFLIYVTAKTKLSQKNVSFDILFLSTFHDLNTYSITDLKTNHASAISAVSDGTVQTEPVDASNFSAVMGMGISAVGTFSNTTLDAMAYAALKFRFKKVDKSKRFAVENDQDIYVSNVQRISVFVGGVISPLAYKGRLLGNPVLNTKPMFGISIDITPDISIDGGVFLFDYLNTDSSLKPDYDAKVKTGTFLSLSIDADAFNRLSSLFRGAPYNKKADE